MFREEVNRSRQRRRSATRLEGRTIRPILILDYAAAFAFSLMSQNFESISNRAPRASWATYSRCPPMLLPFLSAYHQFLPLNFGFTSTTYLNLAGSSHLKVTLRRVASNLTERNAPESLRVIPPDRHPDSIPKYFQPVVRDSIPHTVFPGVPLIPPACSQRPRREVVRVEVLLHDSSDFCFSRTQIEQRVV